MRFGFLTYGLDRPLLGISRAVQELGRALHAHPGGHPVFLTPYRRGPFAEREFPHAYLPGAGMLPGLISFGALEVAAAARRHALPLVHDPCGVSPFWPGRWAGAYKRIVTLYDAIAFRDPGAYTWVNRALHRRYVPATLSNVDAVITVSRHAQDDLRHFLGIPHERLHVVPLAASEAFRPVDQAAAAAVSARYGLRGRYVLYVGALERRKNVTTLLRAATRVRQTVPDVVLAVAGRPRWRHPEIGREIAALEHAGAVRFTGYVPDADLPALYAGAAVFCYPSLLEGFGLPVLEAMACGTPVVCSAAASLPEIAGDAAVLVDPRDEAALADALCDVLGDGAFAGRLRAAGIRRAQRFSWRAAAEQTLDVYRHVLEG